MTYIIAQILGLIVTLLNIVMYQVKRKWHILAIAALGNFVNAANFFFLGGALSAAIISIVGGVQSVLAAHHAYNAKTASNTEKVIFLCAYLACGIWQYNTYIDLLPALGSLFFMIAAFQKEAQKIRIYQLFNSLLWLSYSLILASTAAFAQMFSLVSIIIGLYRFRHKKTDAEVTA
jgi:hypothetical protein